MAIITIEVKFEAGEKVRLINDVAEDPFFVIGHYIDGNQTIKYIVRQGDCVHSEHFDFEIESVE